MRTFTKHIEKEHEEQRKRNRANKTPYHQSNLLNKITWDPLACALEHSNFGDSLKEVQRTCLIERRSNPNLVIVELQCGRNSMEWLVLERNIDYCERSFHK